MEARAINISSTLKSWNIFEVKATGTRHIIGYSPGHGFDVITQEIAHFNYDKKTKSGTGITRTGSVYSLDGHPQKINPNGHFLLLEFMQTHNSKIKFIG